MYVYAALCEMVHAEVYHDPLSSFADGTAVVEIVIGCVIGGFCLFICCVVGAVAYFAQHRNTNEGRSPPTVAAAQVLPTSAASNERVTPVPRLRHAPPTNPDAPPPYVACTNLESSEPPPYTADLINCPVATSLEDTPPFQLFPPEFIPIEDDLPPEYLPPPGSELEMLPLHNAPPTNSNTPSDPPASTAGLNNCSPYPLPIPNDEDVEPEYLPPQGSTA